MWRKIMKYSQLHANNPDKYPEWRTPYEFSEFLSDLKAMIAAFFIDSDSVLGKLGLFFLDNPLLAFLLGCGFAFCAFNVVRSALKTSHL